MSLSGVNQNHCQENQILCHCNLSIKAVFSWSLKVYVMSQFFSNGIFPFFGHTWWYMKMSLKQRKCEKKNPSYYICNRQIPKSIQWLLVINELKFYKEFNFFPKARVEISLPDKTWLCMHQMYDSHIKNHHGSYRVKGSGNTFIITFKNFKSFVNK